MNTGRPHRESPDGTGPVLVIDDEPTGAHVTESLPLETSEEHVHPMIDAATDAFLAWDRTGAIVEWNAQAEAIFGWTKGEAIGRDMASTLLAPAARHTFEGAMAQSPARDARALSGEGFESIGVDRDGNEIPIEVTTWEVRVGDSRRVEALVRSIAARRDLESALCASERLQSLMDASPDVCTFTHIDGTILYMSPSCAVTLGYDPESLVGTPGHEIVHPEDRRKYAEMHTVAMNADGPTTKLLRIGASSGDYIWMETTGCAVRGATGELIGIETVARDVTLRQAVEADRERLVARLGTKNGNLHDALRREQRMVRELGDLNRLKDDVVAMVSHELRTPLTSIVGYAEILSDGDLGALDDDQHRVLDVMDQNARRLLGLVEDLLAIGRIEAGSFRCERAPLPLGPLIESCGAAMMPTARSKSIELVINVEPEVGTIVADAAQLDRLVLNLLGNALKFTPPHGRVALTAWMASDEILIEIADNGVGIPVAEQGQVFSRFYRARQSVADGVPGTGLGLPIAKSIVDQHDGRISLDSRPGRGTTVTVALPRVATRSGSAPLDEDLPIPNQGTP